MGKKNNKKIVINIEKNLYKDYKKNSNSMQLELRLLKEIDYVDTVEKIYFKKESLYINENVLALIDNTLKRSPLNISRTMFIVSTMLKMQKEREL